MPTESPVGTNAHMDWLRDNLSDYQQELAAAEATVARLRPVVANLMGTIEALESPKPNAGLFPAETLKAIEVQEPNGYAHTPFTNPSFTPGARKSGRMPERRAQYTNISIMTAVSEILNTSGKIYHADDLVEAIYDVHTRDQSKAAKRSIVSEALRGASKGLWRKLGSNRYAKNDH